MTGKIENNRDTFSSCWLEENDTSCDPKKNSSGVENCKEVSNCSWQGTFAVHMEKHPLYPWMYVVKSLRTTVLYIKFLNNPLSQET